MNQDDRRRYLLGELLAERAEYDEIGIPADEEGQKKLLRALFNVRPPAPVSGEFLRVQDEYLGEETRRRGVVDADALPASPADRRLVLRRGDITALRIDAIVNAANSALRGCFIPCHSCVDNVIHSASGVQLRLACDKLMTEQGRDELTGRAKITPAFNLPCRYVLHTVGPIVSGALTNRHREQLADCYRSCLALAAQKGLGSVAFCCISTGEFHFPRKAAAEIAVSTVADFLKGDRTIERVVFDVFRQEDYDVYKSLLG